MNIMCFSKSTATGMHFLPLNELIVTLGLGAGLGFFGGLFGIGGGIIAIPLLVLGFGMEQPLAQGTALVLMVPNLLVGWWRYNQRHPLNWRQAALIGLSATLTTWLVAHFAARLAPAYDTCFAHNPAAGKWTRWHQMLVGGKKWDIGADDLLALAKTYDIRHARERLQQIREALARWPEFAATAGVGEAETLRIAALQPAWAKLR